MTVFGLCGLSVPDLSSLGVMSLPAFWSDPRAFAVAAPLPGAVFLQHSASSRFLQVSVQMWHTRGTSPDPCPTIATSLPYPTHPPFYSAIVYFIALTA